MKLGETLLLLYVESYIITFSLTRLSDEQTIKDLSVIKVLLIISNVLLISITLSVKQPELESNLNTHTHTEKWMT